MPTSILPSFEGASSTMQCQFTAERGWRNMELTCAPTSTLKYQVDGTAAVDVHEIYPSSTDFFFDHLRRGDKYTRSVASYLNAKCSFRWAAPDKAPFFLGARKQGLRKSH